MKVSGLEFSLAGDKYLGRSYEEMDCQAFVEKCMADVGLKMDLGGSNSWYRECMKHGWVGSPEECVKEFGSVPKGALLFILEAVGPKTPGKFRDDGVGDVTHMGIVTGRGDGAIHSSHSRGCVANSKFKGKTIPNGGWNRVGLLDRFEYEKDSTSELHTSSALRAPSCPGLPPVLAENEHTGSFSGRYEPQGEGYMSAEKEGGIMPETRYVVGPNNETVNLRKKPEGALIDRIRSGDIAEILTEGAVWSKVRVNGRTGYMMTKFLQDTIEEIVPINPDEIGKEDFEDHDTDELLDLLEETYSALRDLCERIEHAIAKG